MNTPLSKSIIGYMVVGPGEADRYLQESLHDLKRLCDEVHVCLNNADAKTRRMVLDSRGCVVTADNREWGKFQHKIKEDFIYNIVKLKPAWLLCKDADEVFDKKLTRESLQELCQKGHSYQFYVVNMWDEGYVPAMCFWNTRLWKYVPEHGIQFEQKPLHPGLYPAWAYTHANYAPFILKHYGLQKKEDRQRKFERYQKYDPKGQYKPQSWYNNLISEQRVEPFDEERLHMIVRAEVMTYQQKEKTVPKKKQERFYYVKNPHGKPVDIPERHLERTLKKPGFSLISDEPVVVEGGSIASTHTIVNPDPPKSKSVQRRESEIFRARARQNEIAEEPEEEKVEEPKTKSEEIPDEPKEEKPKATRRRSNRKVQRTRKRT